MAVLYHDLITEVEDQTGDELKILSTYEFFVDNPDTAHGDIKRKRPDLLRFNPHPRNSELSTQLFVDRWATAQDDRDPCLFTVNVEYSPWTIEKEQLEQARFEIRTPTWRTTYKQELIFKSPNDGKPFQNTAGDPIAGIQEEKPFWMMNYNFSARNKPRWIRSYAGAINDDEIRLDGESFGKYELLIGDLEITPEFDENAIEFRRINLQIVVHPEKEGWIREFPNVGYYELVWGKSTSRKERVRILDEKGEPVEKPAWLDQGGAAIRWPVESQANGKGSRAITNVEKNRQPLKYPLANEDFIWIKCDTRRKLPFKTLQLK